MSTILEATYTGSECNTKKMNSVNKSRKQLTRAVTLVAIVALLIAQSVVVPTVEARYLPTRSNIDQAKRQEIKEILRLVSVLLIFFGGK